MREYMVTRMGAIPFPVFVTLLRRSEEGKPWITWLQTVHPLTDYETYGLSRYSIFGRQNRKVAHRTAGYLQISMGNHKVRITEGFCTYLLSHAPLGVAFIP